MKRFVCYCMIILSCLAADALAQPTQARLERLIRLNGLPNDEVPVVTAVALQPRGNLVATAGDDHVVRLWDVRQGRLVRELRGHEDWVTAVAFCRDGSKLFTGCRDQKVLIWESSTGRLLGSLGQHDNAITAIVVSPKNDMVAVSGFRSPLKVYDLNSKKLLGQLACPCADIRAIAFSADMQFLAAAGRSGVVRVWNMRAGSKVDINAMRRRVWSVVFTPDSKLLVAGESELISLFEPTGGQLIKRFENRDGKTRAMTWLDGEQFAVANTDNTIRLFSRQSSQPHTVITGHTGSIATLDYRDRTLISGSFDTTVRIWSLHQQSTADIGDEPRVSSRLTIEPPAN